MKLSLILTLALLCGSQASAQEAYFAVERGPEASCEITPRPEPGDTVIGDPDGYPNYEEAQSAVEELCDED